MKTITIEIEPAVWDRLKKAVAGYEERRHEMSAYGHGESLGNISLAAVNVVGNVLLVDLLKNLKKEKRCPPKNPSSTDTRARKP